MEPCFGLSEYKRQDWLLRTGEEGIADRAHMLNDSTIMLNTSMIAAPDADSGALLLTPATASPLASQPILQHLHYFLGEFGIAKRAA
jgi:hypothetical protein